MQEKNYYTIGDVSKAIGVDQHVVRFWTDKFANYIKPIIKAGNRRNYSKHDLEMLQKIKDLLYNRGISIKGVQLMLSEASENITSDKHTKDTNVAKADFNKLNSIKERLLNIANKLSIYSK